MLPSKYATKRAIAATYAAATNTQQYPATRWFGLTVLNHDGDFKPNPPALAYDCTSLR